MAPSESTVVFQPGDIVEIDLPTGPGYVQVTHRHASYPEVVRGIDGTMAACAGDVDRLAAGHSLFIAMFPLAAACASGRIAGRKVGHAAIPEVDRPFPRFRMPVKGKRGETLYWWLWDGEGLEYEADATADISDLPIRQVLTAEAFLQQFGQGGAEQAR